MTAGGATLNFLPRYLLNQIFCYRPLVVYFLFMAKTKEQKTQMLDDVQKVISESASVVFIHSKGLSVNESNEMRARLRDLGAGYGVVKKTLLSRALADTNATGECPPLDGEIAIAYSDDSLVPAREMNKFAKTHKGRIALVGGIFDGGFMSQSEILEIANIPDMQTLHGMFVNVINSPIQGIASVIGQIAKEKA